jgi:hypothetical protein
MSSHDEPALGPEFEFELERAAQDPSLPDRIRRLAHEERLGFLCTQGQGQPYGSVVAFGLSKV